MGRITRIINNDNIKITLQEHKEFAMLRIYRPIGGDVNKRKRGYPVRIDIDVANDIVATLRRMPGVE